MTASATTEPQTGPKPPGALLLNAERLGLLAVFILIVVVFSIVRADTFPTAENWRSIAIGQSITAVAAYALLMPLIAGRFDISVGANIGLCAIMTAALMSETALPLSVAIVAAVATGTFVGFVNGAIVAYLGVNSIVATLGTGTVIGGLIQWYTGGTPISTGISPTLTDLSIQNVLGVPSLFVIMLVISAAVWYLQTQTTWGRRLATVGSNATAAKLVGLDVPRVVCGSFVAGGALAGVAGVLQVAWQGSGDPSVGGFVLILPGLAAVFLGATAFTPGRYNIPGTLLGLYFVGVTVSGLALLGVDVWVEPVFNGSIVVIAVALSAYLRAQRTGEREIGA